VWFDELGILVVNFGFGDFLKVYVDDEFVDVDEIC